MKSDTVQKVPSVDVPFVTLNSLVAFGSTTSDTNPVHVTVGTMTLTSFVFGSIITAIIGFIPTVCVMVTIGLIQWLGRKYGNKDTSSALTVS